MTQLMKVQDLPYYPCNTCARNDDGKCSGCKTWQKIMAKEWDDMCWHLKNPGGYHHVKR